MPPRVVLVGLPGAGKSSVGVRLARRLGVRFADSDQLVTRAAGRSATEIFAADGEPAFRALEAAAIDRALADFDGVLALGGGAVTTESVRRRLAEAGVPVALLTAGRQDLLRRIGRTRHRPLLAGDPAGRLAELETARGALYRQVATVVVDTARRTPAGVARELQYQLTGKRA